tara:strand:+ start:638 stop:1267 length:630 start_codon:yes stop_codon:yes gene_type:complete
MPYLGTQPNNVKKNIGLYNPSEILQLTKDGSWGGSLELIQSQTTSSTPSSVNFTDIKGALYDVHLLTASNTSTSTDDGRIGIRLSNDGGSSYESSNYQTAYQATAADGGSNEYKSTSDNQMEFIVNTGTNANEKGNGYIYLYKLNNSAKYSFSSGMAVSLNSSATLFQWFGGSVYTQTETINAFSIIPDGASGTLDDGIVFKLYGVKQI